MLRKLPQIALELTESLVDGRLATSGKIHLF